MCETIVSKTDGNYSIVMSCATKDRCGHDSIFQEGLEECKHQQDDTECYSCCDHDRCNTLPAALKKLPKDIFADSDEEKITKLADDSLDALEQGQEIYDEEVTTETPEYEDTTESDTESEENIEPEELTTKKSKKASTNAVEELETSTKKPTKKTPKKVESTTASYNKIKASSIDTATPKNSTLGTTVTSFRKTTKNQSEVVKVPRINIDGNPNLMVAFNPNFTDSTTEKTTTRELEIVDIADMIFPDRKNITENDVHVGGVNEAFEDKKHGKGTASALKVSLLTFIMCFTPLLMFTF